MEKIGSVAQKTIEISFYLLFFLVPLILTPINYELFEYNKMMLTYGFTIIIVGFWLIKMIAGRKLILKKTPLDIPLLLFVTSQIVSTIFSIDRHVSIWGYYSRFNGGLLSTISYFLLFYAFVSNFPQEKIKSLLKVTLASGLLVAIYGILEHLGIDKDIWVQDVQNRVFSTLGQPNWLAAYLAILIPVTLGLGLTSILNKYQIPDVKTKNQNLKLKINNWSIGLLVYWVIGIIFYATLIFTKSRSGFIGFWVADIILWIILIIRFEINASKLLLYLNISFVIICFIFGSPFSEINRFTLPELTSNKQTKINNQQITKPVGSSLIEVGITGSDTIRRIVWGGAMDIFRHYPLFGTGVETFAFSYYKFRPAEHNMTSEWDFLYNKAHNEYLNFAATTGAFGLGSYLLIILIFIGWNLKTLILKAGDANEGSQPKMYRSVGIRERQDPQIIITILSLFTAWLSILITNFFGFSVVIVQIFFFLIPAIIFALNGTQSDNQEEKHITFNIQQLLAVLFIFFVICYLLYIILRLWYADVVFADGYHRARSQDGITAAYQSLKKALEINDSEPLYYDEFAFPAAQIAVAFADDKQATLSSALTKEAIIASNFAISIAPQNVNFWKTRTRVFYALSQLDEKYFSDALNSLEQAEILAPTDPKVKYNLGLLYDRLGKKSESINKLEEATKLKSDYRDAFFALAYLYEKNNQRDKAKDSLKYILSKIATDDAEVKKKLEELK
ncbi:O-antigen ligase family protein [Candidatus Gottesmanbacteria bacterium]|nr:O-antigen ligase family protein [Candidatus Gottesmanbacteria bacterium]